MHYFDHEAASKAERFCRDYVSHVKGSWSGRPFDLLPWQVAQIFRPLFGWRRREDGWRRYKTLYLRIPKKQGKSLMGSALALYLLTADGEPAPEVYSVAGSRDQAKIIFGDAQEIIRQSPALSRLCKVQATSILCPRNNGVYRVLSSDAKRAHGYNASAVIFDELHAQPNDRLYNALRGAGVAREQPLHLYLTTAGDRRDGIAWEVDQYAQKVAAGQIQDDSFLAVLYGAEPTDDSFDEVVWRRANPSLGHSVSLQAMRELAVEARSSPRRERNFRQLHLNVWGEPQARFLGAGQWDAGDLTVDPEALLGRPCFAGLDLSQNRDPSSLCLIFPADGPGEPPLQTLSWNWMPEEEVALRIRQSGTPFDAWIAGGHLETCPGATIDRSQIFAKVIELADKYEILEIGIDPYKWEEAARGVESAGVKVVKVQQQYKEMSEPTKRLEEMVLRKLLAHGGHPMLRWAALNVICREDGRGNVMPDRVRSVENIDSAVALIIAISRWMVQPEVKESVYARRGPLVATIGGRASEEDSA